MPGKQDINHATRVQPYRECSHTAVVIKPKNKMVNEEKYKKRNQFISDFEDRWSESEDSDNDEDPDETSLSIAMSEIQTAEDNISTLQALVRIVR